MRRRKRVIGRANRPIVIQEIGTNQRALLLRRVDRHAGPSNDVTTRPHGVAQRAWFLVAGPSCVQGRAWSLVPGTPPAERRNRSTEGPTPPLCPAAVRLMRDD